MPFILTPTHPPNTPLHWPKNYGPAPFCAKKREFWRTIKATETWGVSTVGVGTGFISTSKTRHMISPIYEALPFTGRNLLHNLKA